MQISQELINKKNNLKIKNTDLIICDFDDTIFSRNESFEIFPILKENRGDKGNQIIINEIGIEKFIEKVYSNKNFPKNIINKLRINHDLILTAGINEIQEKKIKKTGLNNINYQVVPQGVNKPKETIQYIINNLGFIPNKIIVYEDRPKYFIEHKEFIESFLGTTLEIMFVEMLDNNTEPKITEVK